MKYFHRLFAELDATNKTSEKVAALADYFASAPPEDAAWGVYFLLGRKPRQAVPARKLASWACETVGVPDWLFEECYDTVGDLAETITLLMPGDPTESAVPLSQWVEDRLLPLRTLHDDEKKIRVTAYWAELSPGERFIWNKFITGSFRVGVAQGLVVRALAAASGIEADVVAERLTGNWLPTRDFFMRLIDPAGADETVRPVPFFLAHALDCEPQSLGQVADWQVEWKWDGIRAQYLSRSDKDGGCLIWSRGEELITERFPELHAVSLHLPDATLIDGEIVPFKDGGIRSFSELQKRIGRKTVGRKMLSDFPVLLLAYDLLALGGVDLRSQPLRERRALLEKVADSIPREAPFQLSPIVPFTDWSELADARSRSRSQGVEGLMIKRLDSPYRVGRVRGDWWKWKTEPLTIDAVLTAAQRGHGKRANLYTDLTFGIWRDGELTTFAKAYSGLDDAEILKVDRFVRAHTLGRFGPVRTVEPKLVFELGFEGVARSSRHKSGVAVRFPRILRWREDKQPADADSLETILSMLDANS